MGDQRREDTDKARRDDAGPIRNADADREHEDVFDTTHAQKQLRMREQARGEVHPDLPERAFEGTGDQERLRERFDALVETTVVSGEALEIVRDMNGPNRGHAGTVLAKLANVTTGADLLVIAELTSSRPGSAVDAALTCAIKPTAAQMRAYLSRIDDALLQDELGDEPTTKKLRAVYQSPITVLPRLPQLLDNAALAAWYLNDTPAEQVAMAMLRRNDVRTVAGQLNQVGDGGRGGWQWALHVTDAMTAVDIGKVEAYGTLCPQPDIASFLQQKAGRAKTIDIGAMRDAADQVDRELRTGKPQVDEVVDALGLALSVGDDELRRSRTRFLANATTRQIDQATQLAGFKPSERVDWLLDGKRVTLDELRDVFAAWPDTELATGLDIKDVERLRKRWPRASPTDVFGRVPMTIYGELAKTPAVRTWVVKTGEPNDILRMLTLWPERTAELAKWVDAHHGWDWLDRVGGGIDDHQLRILALQCGNAAIAQRIQKYQLGDHIDEGSAQLSGRKLDRRATEDPNDRFDRELNFKKNRELSDAAGELRPEDVAELRRDHDKLKKAIANTRGGSLVRLLYVLEPPLRLVLVRGGKAQDVDALNLGGWVRTRPGSDVVDALSDQSAAEAAMHQWPTAPLEIFPQLRQASVLSRVLDANPSTLRWIVENSEPMSALHAIGASGVVKATVSALEEDESVIALLPSGQRLSPRERTYLYGLANNASGQLKQRIMARIEAKAPEDDSDVDERAVGEDRAKRDKAGFAEALRLLLDDSTARVEDILTLCRERAANAGDFVKNNPTLVAQVLARIKQSPLVVFPTVPLDLFIVQPKLAEPTFDSVPSFVILREAATNGALAMVLAKHLDRRVQIFLSWLRQLPAASGLSPVEQAGLKRVCAALMTDEAAREVFEARFGSSASKSYTHAEVSRLWSTLERLPRAHVDQGAVSGFYEYGKDSKPQDGEFSPTTRSIGMKEDLITRSGAGDQNYVYDRNDTASTEMTADQAKIAFGLDDAQLQQWVADGRLKLDNGVYTANQQLTPDRFTGTALHEVGHGVDQMLGNNTELVFKLAEWRQYGDADFDAWANDLGGWDRVKPEDKKKIRDAWTMWANSTQATGRPPKQLTDLVGFDHPALAAAYAGVGVVDFATDPDQRGGPDKPFLRNGRGYIMNGVYQRKYSVPVKTLHSAPSEYSLNAPEEYFAECYMTYYLTYDGTPKTATEKGKLLAPWIKKWFDENIDKVGHNPSKGSY